MSDLSQVLNEINKKYDGIVMKGSNFPKLDKIPFSSPRINYMTYGGIALGKACELFGPENGGKTTTALDIVKNAQIKAKNDYSQLISSMQTELDELKEKNNKTDKKRIKDLETELDELKDKGMKRVVYVDAENTLDDEWAQTIGVDLDELILIKPHEQTAEQILQMILDIIKSDGVILVVLDSIPMLVSQQAFENTLEKKTYAGNSGALSEFSNKVAQLLYKHETAFVAINQVREDFDNPYNMYKTPGGKALKHLFTVRLLVRKGRFIDERCQELNNSADTPAGNLVDIRVEKTKLFKPDRRLGYYTLNYSTGVDIINDTIDIAVMYDIIQQGGSWFTVLTEKGEPMEVDGNILKFQGKPKLIDCLKSNKEVFDSVYSRVNDIVSR